MIEDQILRCHYCGKLISKHNRLTEKIIVFHEGCLGAWYEENFMMDD